MRRPATIQGGGAAEDGARARTLERTKPADGKKPGHEDRALVSLSLTKSLLRGLVGDGGVVTVGVIGLVDITFDFTVGLSAGFSLGATARALGELGFDLLHSLGLRRVLHDSDLARQPVERRFIELAFAVGL